MNTPDLGGRPPVGSARTVRFSDELLNLVDAAAARKGTSRAHWLRRAAEQRLAASYANGIVPAEPGEATHVEEHDVVVDGLRQSGPEIRVLGPVEVVGVAGESNDEITARRVSLTEIEAYLVLHPGRDHNRLEGAIWPQGVDRSTRNVQISRLRRWFGKSPAGEDYVPRVAQSAGYLLHPGVGCDWLEWQRRCTGNVSTASTASTETLLSALKPLPVRLC